MEKFISIYWFLILILTAGGISAMVFAFYSHPYDVREAEAFILGEKVADCISNNGRINEWIEINKDDFLKKCHLNFNTEFKEQGQYYVKAEIFEINSLNDLNLDTDNLKVFFESGNPAIITHCKPQEEKEIEKLSKCSENVFYSLDSENNQYLIKILSIVKKTEKNTK